MILFFGILSQSSYAVGQDFSEFYNSKKFELLSENKSLLLCGSGKKSVVFSTFESKLLLVLSNYFLNKKLNPDIDWIHFTPPPVSSENFSETNMKLLSSELKQLLFVCLVWHDSQRLELFVIKDEEIQKQLLRVKKDRPWKTLPEALVSKIDQLPEQNLKKYIYMILRTQIFQDTRGNLLQNKNLWFTHWTWLVPSKLHGS